MTDRPFRCRTAVWLLALSTLGVSSLSAQDAAVRETGAEGQAGADEDPSVVAEQRRAKAMIETAMGTWKGSYEHDNGGGDLTVQVYPKGGNRFGARFFVDMDGGLRELAGDATAEMREDGKVALSGDLDMGEEIGTLAWYADLGRDGFDGKAEADGVNVTLELAREIVVPETLGQKPPENAVVLLGEGLGLSLFEKVGGGEARWKVIGNGDVEVAPKSGSIRSKFTLGDHKLHVEFRTPIMPEARGQRRGNSGVYLQGRYEVQVLDSFGLPPKDNEAGGIYQVAVPKVNASLPPGQWQTYDIDFKAPEFDDQGKLTEPGRITVLHNGTLIHDGVELTKPTVGAVGDDPTAKGGLMLQDHNDPVRYRNVWAVEPNTPLPSKVLDEGKDGGKVDQRQR